MAPTSRKVSMCVLTVCLIKFFVDFNYTNAV